MNENDNSSVDPLEEAGGGSIAAITGVSFLDPNSIKWMNRRRGAPSLAKTKLHTTLARALQLQSIFRGLDFDECGVISLPELAEALEYVATISDSSGKKVINDDPKKLIQFFEAMDTDGSKTIDFHEFSVGMGNMPASIHDSDEDAEKLQQAFFEYASQHRRGNFVNRLNNDSLPTMERYDNLRRLFEVKFFRESKDKGMGTIEEQIGQETQIAEHAKKEISTDYWKMRKGEYERTRAAHTFLKFEKKEEKQQLGSMVQQLVDNNVDSPLRVSTNAKYKIKKHMSQFSLDTHNPHIAPLKVARPRTNYELKSVVDIKKIRYGSKQEFRESILPPPKTVRQIRMLAASKSQQLSNFARLKDQN